MSSVREYAVLYLGKRVSGGTSGGTIGGGNAILNAGQHALDGPEHTGQLPADRSSYDPTASGLVAADVQVALDEEAAAIAAHLADTTAAHDASAIGFTPNGSIAATDVQAAIQEVRDEAGGGSFGDLDGGIPSSTYGGITAIDAGGP